MAFVDPKFPGVAYGVGTITEDGEPGQLVKLTGADQFALNDDPTVRSFGILYKSAVADELCTVFTDGGIYETDSFEGTINPGDLLKADATTKNMVAGVGAGDVAVAEAIGVTGGILRFKLLV
jgi:hypothetical protein